MRRHKISVKDGNEISLGLLQTFLKRACLKPCAVPAVQIVYECPASLKLHLPASAQALRFHPWSHQAPGLQKFPWILQLSSGTDEALHNIQLIVHRQLNGDPGKMFRERGLGTAGAPVFKVEIQYMVAVGCVHHQQPQHG